MTELEIVGYLAGFLVAFALYPQLIKTWKTKSTKEAYEEMRKTLES